jgi:hypothetical protein
MLRRGFPPRKEGVLRVFLLLIPRRAMHPKAGINTGLPIDFYGSYLPLPTLLQVPQLFVAVASL